jgi:hypothetical protein
MSFAPWDTHLPIFDHQFDLEIFFALQQHQIISQVHKSPQSPKNLQDCKSVSPLLDSHHNKKM